MTLKFLGETLETRYPKLRTSVLNKDNWSEEDQKWKMTDEKNNTVLEALELFQ